VNADNLVSPSITLAGVLSADKHPDTPTLTHDMQLMQVETLVTCIICVCLFLNKTTSRKMTHCKLK